MDEIAEKESHLIRVDITHDTTCRFGCTIYNGSGEMLLDIAPRYTDKIKAVKAGLHHLTENDLLPALEAV